MNSNSIAKKNKNGDFLHLNSAFLKNCDLISLKKKKGKNIT